MDALEPALDVEQFLSGLAVHHSSIAADVIIEFRLQTAVRHEVDLASEDMLDELFEANDAER